eukprot:s2927_g9.t1
MEVRFASSGAVAAQLALQEFEGKTAKEVKQRLADTLGTSRHRVRLLLDHEVVPDDQVFEAQTSLLQLVLIPFRPFEGEMVWDMLTAVCDDAVVALERMLALPLDPSACVSSSGWFPLFCAVNRQHVACVKLLLNAHANVHSTFMEQSPLSFAAACGNATLVGLLLEARACTEHRDHNDGTPLILASTHANITVVAQLVAARASLTAKDCRGFTPLHCAAHYDQLNWTLLARADADLATDDGGRPLMHAASNGRLEVCRLLIAAGADVNYMWAAQYTALWLAARDRNAALASLLVDSGAATAPALAKAKKNGDHAIIDFVQRIAAKRHRPDTTDRTGDDAVC